MRIKTHPITAVLTSAYLSAMLTSSLAPIRNNAIFAATVDPSAAQKALQDAVSGLDAAGWAAAVSATPSPSKSEPTPVPVKVAPKTDPVMTEELMARLIKFTIAENAATFFDKQMCKGFGINDGTVDAPVKQVSEPVSDGKHYFVLFDGSKDIVIAYKHAATGRVYAYQTDKTGVLRAAGIFEKNVFRLITNEQAAEAYKAELKLFAGLAKDLPPAGAAVAGNS